ncbi:MAG: hypothetical protein ACXWLM_01445 [Myxococcales bacterium]
MLLLALLLATPHMTYHGGKVLSAPKYYNIYWGNYWWDHADQTSWFESFTREVAPSWQLASQVTEYSVGDMTLGAGSFGGGVVVREDPPPTITDDDLEDFIEKQIEAKIVPPSDAHNVYSVFLAPGIKIQNEDGALAYHGPSAWGFHKIMVHFDSYVLDVASRDVAAVSFSHEMAETMTDPDLDGWYDDTIADYRGEVGDVCQGHLATVGTYTIQQEWSNAANSCMASRDIPIPSGGGKCPDGTHAEGADCIGNLIGWGCNGAGAGFPAALAMLLTLAGRSSRRRRSR